MSECYECEKKVDKVVMLDSHNGVCNECYEKLVSEAREEKIRNDVQYDYPINNMDEGDSCE